MVDPKGMELKVWTTGKGGFLVANTKESIPSPIFYGNDKVVYQLRVPGGGAEGDNFTVSVVDLRMPNPRTSVQVVRKDGVLRVDCGDRPMPFTPLSEEETKAFLAKVVLREHLWRRVSQQLARDDDGNYYYVDALRPSDSGAAQAPRDPRLFVGPRGKMKLVEIVNAVFDSEGEIYKTRSGTFRLVMNSKKSGSPDCRWVSGKKETELVRVPVEDNLGVIWNDLGVYTSQRYGSPCDDL
jgi:hypothetical protein